MKRGLSIILSLMLALLCGACQGGARDAAYTAPGLEQKSRQLAGEDGAGQPFDQLFLFIRGQRREAGGMG